MNSSPSLSIVIPVYNVEKYIVKCISSIISQRDFDKTELIIINDGTKDNSIGLVEHMIEELPNVVLYNQENAGLSRARNAGLRIAKGEYVWFVDGDDYIDKQAISLLLKLFDSHLDCYGINLLWENENDGTIHEVGRWHKSNTVPTGIEFMRYMDHLTPVQRYVVKRKILIDNNIYFLPDILHEDYEYVPRLLYYIKGVDIVEVPLYYYLRRMSGSITARISDRNLNGLCQGVYSVARFTDNCVRDEARVAYHEKLYEMFQHFIHKYSEYLNEKEDWSILKQNLLNLNSVLKNIKGSLPLKDRIHVNCFLKFPFVYVKYRKLRVA
jgi:glycosyltransferase involved in cell wall biosynthesis